MELSFCRTQELLGFRVRLSQPCYIESLLFPLLTLDENYKSLLTNCRKSLKMVTFSTFPSYMIYNNILHIFKQIFAGVGRVGGLVEISSAREPMMQG